MMERTSKEEYLNNIQSVQKLMSYSRSISEKINQAPTGKCSHGDSQLSMLGKIPQRDKAIEAKKDKYTHPSPATCNLFIPRLH